jgi:predicted GNAT family acetyltransferase
MGDETTLQVNRNDRTQRYELWNDGDLVGAAAYHDRDGRRTFTHTAVDDEREGEGLGSTLARAALDDTRAQGKAVVPICPFIAGWIDRHVEYGDLVDREMLDRIAG